jgi:hypothetical protein
VPVEKFKSPTACAIVPAATFPVTLSVPVELFLAADDGLAPPAVRFPVMFNVPVLVLSAAKALLPVPPVQLPTMEAEFPDVKPNVTHETLLPAITLAVSVIPFCKANDPPLVALLALSFRTSPTVVSTLTVMAKLLECSTSLLVKVDHTSAAEPVGVVAQTSVAFMFAAFLAK